MPWNGTWMVRSYQIISDHRRLTPADVLTSDSQQTWSVTSNILIAVHPLYIQPFPGKGSCKDVNDGIVLATIRPLKQTSLSDNDVCWIHSTLKEVDTRRLQLKLTYRYLEWLPFTRTQVLTPSLSL